MCLPPFTLNPKMKIPLYLRSPNKFWAWRWRCRSWYTSSLELSHVLARREPSRDRVPRADGRGGDFAEAPRKLRGRKLRGSSAEATGWVWEYLVTPSLPQYQLPSDRLWLEPSTTRGPPLNTLPSDRLWLQPFNASPNSPF